MAELNRSLFELLFQLSGQNAIFDGVTIFLARFLPYFLVLGFLIFVFKRPAWKMRWLIFAEGALAVILARGIVTEIIRFFYHRPR
ncbi:MAG: hypothetical protein ACE5HI_09150, partial [bacterium]